MDSLKLEIASGARSRTLARSARWSALVGALCAATACSDDPVDLGDGLLVVDRSALSSYAASWTGYVEAKTFPSGSDRLRLQLDESGNGIIILGEGDAPPLPTEAEDPFGTGDVPREFLGTFEGFSYAIQGALVEDERIRARADTSAHMAAACALQTSFPLEGSDAFGCFPFPFNLSASAEDELGNRRCEAFASNTGPRHEVPCWQLELCGSCVCEAAGCRAQSPTEFQFDGALDDTGTRLEGTIVNNGINAPPFDATIRLVRQE